MTLTTAHHQSQEIHAAGARHRQLRMIQVLFAGAAAIAMFALFDAARPGTAETVLESGSVRLTDKAIDLPAPASGPFGPQYPQTPPGLVGNGGLAADGDDDQDQAEQQEQLALQEMQQAEQQAEQQNEIAQQEAQQAEQQGQWVEDHPGP
ncbi:MAG: hypothetical protein ACLP5J_17235 [Mycobacterium sp.]|uniref:hypothetical protein n=1 Tax=Mycobacterium sp. TaxID=1785 RepID=UPI003F97B563